MAIVNENDAWVVAPRNLQARTGNVGAGNRRTRKRLPQERDIAAYSATVLEQAPDRRVDVPADEIDLVAREIRLVRREEARLLAEQPVVAVGEVVKVDAMTHGARFPLR